MNGGNDLGEHLMAKMKDGSWQLREHEQVTTAMDIAFQDENGTTLYAARIGVQG